MNNLELIDRLCTVAETQARIIREQALFIEEQMTVDDEIKKKFAEQRETVDSELDSLGVGLRPFRNGASAERRV